MTDGGSGLGSALHPGQAMLRTLAIPRYARLLGAYTVNSVGDWFGEIALAVLVYSATGSPLWVAAVLVAGRLLPSLVGPLVIAHVERVGTRGLPVLYVVEAMLFGLLALVASDVAVVVALVILFADGVVAHAARSLTRAAMVATTSAAGRLREGNTLLNIAFTSSGVVGPALAGVVVAASSPQTALALNALSFLLAAGLVARAGRAPRPDDERTVLGAVLGGLRHVASVAGLRPLLLAEAVAGVLFALVAPVEIVLVTDTLGGTEAEFGLVLTAWGLGMVAGGAAVPLLARRRLDVVLIAAYGVMAASYVGIGLAPSISAVVAWSVVGGMANGLDGYALMTMVHERTAPDRQGQVNGFLESINTIGPGIGFVAGGVMAEVLSARPVYLVAGIGAGVLALVVGLALRATIQEEVRRASLARA